MMFIVDLGWSRAARAGPVGELEKGGSPSTTTIRLVEPSLKRRNRRWIVLRLLRLRLKSVGVAVGVAANMREARLLLSLLLRSSPLLEDFEDEVMRRRS